MDDLEITRLCAEAMGITVYSNDAKCYLSRMDMAMYVGQPPTWVFRHFYAPLHDDAQAMALVKKFRLRIDGDGNISDYSKWLVEYWPEGATSSEEESLSDNLNRAICITVAQMQKAK